MSLLKEKGHDSVVRATWVIALYQLVFAAQLGRLELRSQSIHRSDQLTGGFPSREI